MKNNFYQIRIFILILLGIFFSVVSYAQINDTWHSESLLYSRTNNLILNGSFENGITGTQSTLMGASPCNTGFPTSWTSFSALIPQGDGLTSYITAGPQTMRLHKSPGSCELGDPMSATNTFPVAPAHGSKMVYMGNWTNVRALPAPNHNYDKGTILPNNTNLTRTANMTTESDGDYNKPIDLTQTISGLVAGDNYGVEVWATNEDNEKPEGLFEVQLRFLNSSNATVGTIQRIYFVCPSNNVNSKLGYGNAERFYVEFTVPTGGAKVIFTVQNWGHFSSILNPNWTTHLSPTGVAEEVTIDDIVMQKLLNVTGKVFVDANGDALGTATGVEPTALSAVLTDVNGTIIQIVPVNADGTYSITAAPANTSGLKIAICPTSSLNSTRRGAAVGQQTEAIGTASWYFTGTNINGGSVIVAPNTTTLPEISFNTASSDVVGLNFGLNQPPTANNETSTQTNIVPVGNTQYTLSTFGSVLVLNGSDPQDGALGSGETMVITTITDPVTEGILYYNGIAVVAGQTITNYNPALLTFNPVDRSIPSFPVNFTYQTVDAAGIKSPAATISFTIDTKVSISGNLFVDANGNALEVSGNGVEPIPMYAVLTNSVGAVIQNVQLNSDGSFTFNNAPAGTSGLNVYISTTSAAIGSVVTASTYPTGWLATGTNVSNTSPNTAGRKFTLNTTNVNLAAYNFGINQPPTANTVNSMQANNILVGSTQYPLTTFGSNLLLNGRDPQDGVLDSAETMIITTITDPATEGVLYYNGVAVTAGQTIPNYNPTLLTFNPADRSLASFPVNFTYQTVDAAGATSVPATVSFSINAKISISGNLFLDANGNALEVAGNGIKPASVYAVLTNSSDIVIDRISLSADGSFSFSNAPAGTSGLNVYLRTAYPSIGTTVTESTYPTGWLATGTNISNTNPNSLGREFTLNTTNVNLAAYNFGINQPPTARTVSNTIPNNIPVGNTQYPLSTFGTNLALNGNDPQDGVLDSAETMIITTITDSLTEGILYYNGVAVTAGQTISNYNPTLLTFNPADRSLASFPVNFTYQTVDAAGATSVPATVSFQINTTITIAGNLFLDANGNALEVIGNGIEPINMFAILTTSTNRVIQSVPLNSDGTFSISNAPAGTNGLNVYIRTANVVPGNFVAVSTYPAGWASTGTNVSETLPSTTGTKFTVNTSNVNLATYNFGIEQLPNTDNKVYSIPSPDEDAILSLNTDNGMGGLTGTDPEDGIKSIGDVFKITDLSLMNGNVLWYDEDGNGIMDAGETITVGTTITNFDVNKLKVMFSGSGSLYFRFSYVSIDNAGKQDPSPATYTVVWSTPILPVELLSFTGLSNNCEITLLWKTASEINFDEFEIQCSIDGSTYKTLTSVAGMGNATHGSEYQYKGLQSEEWAYYRLKMIDNDGTYKYSSTIILNSDCLAGANGIIVFPNPVSELMVINFNNASDDSEAFITVINMNGQTVHSQATNINKGINQYVINVSALLEGHYYIKLFTKNQDFQIKPIIIKH